MQRKAAAPIQRTSRAIHKLEAIEISMHSVILTGKMGRFYAMRIIFSRLPETHKFFENILQKTLIAAPFHAMMNLHFMDDWLPPVRGERFS
jgi:hypothetical protein